MNVLITGSNSFLGKSIVLKHNLIRMDHAQLDVTDFEKVKRVFSENEIDVVIHTATKGGKRNQTDSPSDFYDNLLMLENLLFFKSGYKKLFVFGSGAEYNRLNDITNVRENDFSSIPVDFYGLSKYINSQRVSREDKVINLRLFNCFGPLEDDARFIKSCLTNYINRKDICILQNRFFDFFGIKDLIKILEYFIRDESAGNSSTYNCCYAEKLTLLHVAERINNLSDHKIQITIENKIAGKNYTGNNEQLIKTGIEFNGFDSELKTMYVELAGTKNLKGSFKD